MARVARDDGARCKNCGEPIERDVSTVYMNYHPRQNRWLHDRPGRGQVCYPQGGPPYTRAEKCEHAWYEVEVGCEDCGDHPGVRCLACGHVVDLVMSGDPRDEPQVEAFQKLVELSEELGLYDE